MAVPQRRTSKTRKRTRRTHFHIQAKGLVACPHCGEMIQPHKVCPFCGYYNGKPIVAKKNKKEDTAKNKDVKKADKKAEKKAKKAEENKENKK